MNSLKNTKFLTLSSVILAFIIILGYVPPLNIFVVPIVVQNLGILLAGVILPMVWSVLVVGLFLMLVLIGLPVLPGMQGGFLMFTSPVGGYLIGYFLSAVLLPWAFRHSDWESRPYKYFIKVILFGVVPISIFGIIGMFMTTPLMPAKAFLVNLDYVPGDVFKAFLVILIVQRLKSRRII